MPIHDWTMVDSGIFHAFDFHWIGATGSALNECLLPSEYYCLPEQVAGLGNPDVCHSN